MDRTELIATVTRDLLVAALAAKQMPSDIPVASPQAEHARELGESFASLFAIVAKCVNEEVIRRKA